MKVFKKSYFLKFIICLFFYLILAVNAAPVVSNGASAVAPHTTPTTTARRAAVTSAPSGQRNGAGQININSNEWWTTIYGSVNGTPKQMFALSCILIVFGLYLCSMGLKRFRPTVAVMGSLTFGLLTWIGLANCRPEHGYAGDTLVMIVVPVCIGALGAGISYVKFDIMKFAAGALGGLASSIYICTWRYNFIIGNVFGRYAFVIGLALVCAISMRFQAEIAMIFSSSFVGAYIIVLGIDIFARKGYIAGFESLLNVNPHSRVEYTVSTFVYVFLALTLVLFLASFGWQFKNHSRMQLEERIRREEEEERLMMEIEEQKYQEMMSSQQGSQNNEQ